MKSAFWGGRYHKDNVHLAEAAQIMTQNVQFDIPSIRKLLQQTLKQQQVPPCPGFGFRVWGLGFGSS